MRAAGRALVLISALNALGAAGACPPAPRLGDPLGGLSADQLDRFRQGQEVFERFTLYELHHDQRGGARLEQFVDLADVRMVERGCRERLGPQPEQSVAAGCIRVADGLHGDRPVQAGVNGLPDDAHAAAAQTCNDAVGADDLSYHQAPAMFPLDRFADQVRLSSAADYRQIGGNTKANDDVDDRALRLRNL